MYYFTVLEVWVLCSGSQQAKIKASAGPSCLSPEALGGMHTKIVQVAVRIQCGCRLRFEVRFPLPALFLLAPYLSAPRGPHIPSQVAPSIFKANESGSYSSHASVSPTLPSAPNKRKHLFFFF